MVVFAVQLLFDNCMVSESSSAASEDDNQDSQDLGGQRSINLVLQGVHGGGHRQESRGLRASAPARREVSGAGRL